MKRIYDVLLTHLEDEGESFLRKLEGKRPLFVCVIGTTDAAKIPGISVAGESPEPADYTPPTDVELLLLGRCKSIDGVPITPNEIPTPTLITTSALRLTGIPALIARAGLRASSIDFGSLRDDPIEAILCVGDPVMPTLAGLVAGATKKVPVLMAGGAQMVAILALLRELSPSALRNVSIETTKWIVEDRMSDLKGIVPQITDVPILAARLDFSKSRFDGLRVYGREVVEEWVRAGGAPIATMVKSRGAITGEGILREVERNYKLMLVQSDV